MKLDRNINPDGGGKYALIKLRVDKPFQTSEKFMRVHREAVDFGSTPDTDFFVIRIKDKYAGPALLAYANAAESDDPEYAQEIRDLAEKAMKRRNQRRPD